jgi:hypothetical protein
MRGSYRIKMQLPRARKKGDGGIYITEIYSPQKMTFTPGFRPASRVAVVAGAFSQSARVFLFLIFDRDFSLSLSDHLI